MVIYNVKKKLNQISLFGSSFKGAAVLLRDDHSVSSDTIHLKKQNPLSWALCRQERLFIRITDSTL